MRLKSNSGTRVRDVSAAITDSPRTQTKYLDIVSHFRDALRTDRYAPGSRLPSEAELVRRFSVSRMTVVKAMQILEQDGLVIRRVGSGTFAAPRENSGAKVFGLLIPDLGATEIFEPICRGMMMAPSHAGHSLSWGHLPTAGALSEDNVEALCRQYIEQRVDGIFFAPLEFPVHRDINHRILGLLMKARIPVVLLDRDVTDFPHRSQCDLVSLDNRRAGFLVTDHLVRQGATRVGFFARPHSAETVDHRIVGYREALYSHGHQLVESLVMRGEADDLTFVKKAIEAAKPDAIMCANDHTAAQLMQTLLGLGYRIPNDMRLAGVDDVRYARLLPVPLTTFHQPCAEIGAASLSAMVERINSPSLPPRSILLNGSLVVRQSCGSKQSSEEPARRERGESAIGQTP